MNARAAVRLLAIGRLSIGTVLAINPSVGTRMWIHRRGLADPSTVLARGLGARDVGIGAGLLLAAQGGGSMRPWLLAGLAGDIADLGGSIAVRDRLPGPAIPFIVAAAGTGIALGAIGLAGAGDASASAAPVPA